jgi:GTP-binding protein
MANPLRNIAIVAHVDHGKTTLVDSMLYQSGMFRDAELDRLAGGQHGLIMDSGDLERERGITILSKNCAIRYQALDGITYRLNIIDTPGHADFGGEVERVLRMADGVLLLVDAFEGPMPQTRFVLEKALGHGLRPILVVNKADRHDARPYEVLEEALELIVDLGGGLEALEAPAFFASGRDGWATRDLEIPSSDLRPLLEGIVTEVPAPKDPVDAPLQMLVTSLDASDYVGRIAIGRVFAGRINRGEDVVILKREGGRSRGRVNILEIFDGLSRRKVESVEAGDIAVVAGLEGIDIGDTIADREQPAPLPPVEIDKPTLHMTLRVNDSPFAGREGNHITSRKIRERLDRELRSNVALQVDPGDTPDEFRLAGRGLMHLGILLEGMRREGFEFAAGTPKVIYRQIDGKRHEPIENLVIDCPREAQSAVMGLVGERRAEMVGIDTRDRGDDHIHMRFTIPARGLIGLRSRILTATRGEAVVYHTFFDYEPHRGSIPNRANGALVSTERGAVTAYALDALYDRGAFFVAPGDQVYPGQIVGEHCKDKDLAINVVRTKKLSNVRASGKDEAAQVRPPRKMSLESHLEFLQDDELLEVTPKSLRLRKRILDEGERRRASRRKAADA